MKAHSQSKSEYKMSIREQAKRKIHPDHSLKQAQYRSAVESERQKLLTKSSEAGDPKAKKIRSELTFLLNNYTPAHDARIEQLIEEWRKTGDPQYDPMIRIKLRQARQSHMRETPSA